MAKLYTGAAQGVIEAPVDKVWELVSDFGGLKKWNTSDRLKSCEIIKGDPKIPGCVRAIVAEYGGNEASLTEVLLELSEEQHLFKYQIEKPPPFLAGLTASVKLNKLGDSSTEIVWSYELPAAGDRLDENHEKLISGSVLPVYQSSIEILKSHF